METSFSLNPTAQNNFITVHKKKPFLNKIKPCTENYIMHDQITIM